MKVLFDARLLHRPLSGLERVQRNLVRELAAHRGIERLRVLVQTGTRPPDGFPARAELVPVSGTEDILRELIDPQRKSDVYHLTWFPDRNPRDVWLPVAAPASVVEVHDAILNRHPEYHPSSESWQWYHAFVCTLVRGADRLLVHSKSVITEVERDLGGDRNRCDLAPLAVEPTLRTPLSASEAAARRKRLGAPPTYFIAVGKDYPHKGHATLFRALAQLPLRVPVVCAGSQVWHGPESTRALLAELGLTDSVRWLEGLADDDIKALIQGAKALVYPSTEEGFGLPPIEAMALGTPVVAAAAMSIPEVCGDGAWLFPPGDHRVLAELLQRVLAGGKPVEELVARGKACEHNYTWQRTGQAVFACYRKAVEAARASGKRRRPTVPKDLLPVLDVSSRSPFSAERELAAWQERCLSVENSLREAQSELARLGSRMQAAAFPPPPEPGAPVAAAAGSRPRFSLGRRIRKIREGLKKRMEKK